LQDAGANAPRLNQLLDSSLADGDQGEFGGGKKRVSCYQSQNKQGSEQNKSYH
jgi:hypothetical protein